MGTVPGRFRGRAPPLLGTVPDRFRGRASPLLTQSTRTEARSRRTTAAKRNKKQVLQNLQVSAKGWGDYTCSLSTAQREQVNVRERVKLDVEFAKIKDTFLHTSKSRSLDFCSVPSQFCRKDSDRERKYIWTMRVRWTMSLLICLW